MIRVLRVIEYTYPDVEAMNKDMDRWTVSLPGVRSAVVSISSNALPYLVDVDDVDDVDDVRVGDGG